MQKLLLVFVKNPVLGRVKTRLAATMGEERALTIYRALLERTRVVALKADATRWVWYSDWIEQEDAWTAPHFVKKLQKGEDLGSRMRHAFDEALQDHDMAVIIGSDCPLLQGEYIRTAFLLLESHDVVLGPSTDGGYYLLGMKRMYPELFEDIPWSTSSVFEQTLQKIEALNLSYSTLPPLPDVDHEADWEQHGWEIAI